MDRIQTQPNGTTPKYDIESQMGNFAHHDELVQSIEGYLSKLRQEVENHFAQSGGVRRTVLKLAMYYINYGTLTKLLSQLKDRYLETKLGSDAMEVTSAELTLRTLGDIMQYPNLPAWILYKLTAYNPDLLINTELAEMNLSISSEPVNNWGDLVKHALKKEGYICGRRLHFFTIKYAEFSGKKDVANELAQVNPWEMNFEQHGHLFSQIFDSQTDLINLLNSEDFLTFADSEFQQEWQSLEEDSNGKWEDYPRGRAQLIQEQRNQFISNRNLLFTNVES